MSLSRLSELIKFWNLKLTDGVVADPENANTTHYSSIFELN